MKTLLFMIECTRAEDGWISDRMHSKLMTRIALGCLAFTYFLEANPMMPLRVDSTGRYFEAGTKPWFWLGDTAWPLGVKYTSEEADQYLEARARTGFSIIQMSCIWDGGTGTETGPSPNPNFAGETPWLEQNPLKPNEKYWQNIDRVVKSAARHGLYLGLLPAWGSYVVNEKLITLDNAEQYGRWLGARYRSPPNIIWVVGGDRKTSQEREVWRALARGLQQGDGGEHLITFHPGGERRASSHAFAREPWLAANMIQTWANYTDIPDIVAADYALSPPKPVILGEGAYEAGPEYPTRPITPLVVRKQAYWTYLSGGSFTYGHNDMWRKNPTWRESLQSEGAHQMGILKGIFAHLDWWHLVPDNSMLGDEVGTGKYRNAAARSSDGKWAIIYFSHPQTARLHLIAMNDSKCRATWIDPHNGSRKPGKQKNGDQEWSVPEGWDDAMLLLQVP
jgi:Protein of unknown function (DUF4038)/Putative collagen-binding domain of a collagenase